MPNAIRNGFVSLPSCGDRWLCCGWTLWLLASVITLLSVAETSLAEDHAHGHVKFQVQSVKNGNWSDPATWKPKRVPVAGDRVLVSRGTEVTYDVREAAVIRLVQVVGTLSFSRTRNTELNVGLLKVQNSDHCSEDGFACDFLQVNESREPTASPEGRLPALLIGTPDNPIPAKHTAVVRLHYLEGMHRDNAPAIACCSARMEIHGAPLSRTWTKLAGNVEVGERLVTLADEVSGWRAGDSIIVTASERTSRGGSYRDDPDVQTEERTIAKIEGKTITLDRPLTYSHLGEGLYRSEVANLSRNVTIESADPDGVRGHTVFHRFSQGGVSYARFAHLGKEGVLGRYALHFHLVGDTMRGAGVRGAAIVDSHNRWLTIHGTNYLIVRDCVGYGSVGHGYFLEDGTEVYNLLDRNLGVHAFRGKRLPDQVLPFDPNDGAAFWWANGRNSFVRNVACENDEYGYRYDMQKTSRFDSTLRILQPDGEYAEVDVRTIPIWRFEQNESHSEGVYGMLVAANGNRQPDHAIHNKRMLDNLKRVDWTGPDREHPHVIRDLKIWNVHYAFRPHSPAMFVQDLHIHRAAYGVYRPAFENQVYRNVTISMVAAEPFNRGMDDASAQTGKITVDGLTFATGYGNRSTPLVQISDINLSGDAETHFRNVTVERPKQFQDRWPLFNRGVGPRVPPITPGVPIYVHDYFGPGRDAKVVSTAAKDLLDDGNRYESRPPLTGNESRVAEVSKTPWPELLNLVDDIPPATVITSITKRNGRLVVQGVSHDNGRITNVEVNGRNAKLTKSAPGVVDWAVEFPGSVDSESVTAIARDDSGNLEKTGHAIQLKTR